MKKRAGARHQHHADARRATLAISPLAKAAVAVLCAPIVLLCLWKIGALAEHVVGIGNLPKPVETFVGLAFFMGYALAPLAAMILVIWMFAWGLRRGSVPGWFIALVVVNVVLAIWVSQLRIF